MAADRASIVLARRRSLGGDVRRLLGVMVDERMLQFAWDDLDLPLGEIRTGDPDYLLVGTDGGLYESFDLAENWRFMANLPVTQFYKLAVQWRAVEVGSLPGVPATAGFADFRQPRSGDAAGRRRGGGKVPPEQPAPRRTGCRSCHRGTLRRGDRGAVYRGRNGGGARQLVSRSAPAD